MKKKELEIILESLESFQSPDVRLEQYPTPPPLASELLVFASLKGDLDGTVFDLGCGTGILAIGAKLLGAERVVGFDIDPESIAIARGNARRLNLDVEFRVMDIEDIEGEADTVVMNPPFGIKKRHADRAFLEKALEVGDVIYTIHSAGSRVFVEKFISPSRVTDYMELKIPMKKIYKFHRKDVRYIDVELFRIERV